MDKRQTDLLVGILLLVVGILLVVGKASLGPLVYIAAVAALVVGIYLLVTKTAPQNVAIALIVVGILVLAVDFIGHTIAFVLNLLVGIACIVAGATKLAHKW